MKVQEVIISEAGPASKALCRSKNLIMHWVPVSWQVVKVKVTENVQEKNLTRLARREFMFLERRLKASHTADHYHCIVNENIDNRI